MRFLTLMLMFVPCVSRFAVAGDWPQVLGPTRDGQASGETLPNWSEPPAIRWRVPCGAGYAGVAVVGERVFLWHRENNEERLDCLSSVDGHRLWRAAFPATYRGGVDADLGPRCVPVVAGDQVYVYGAAGDLHAVSLASGTSVWTRELRSDYEAEDGYFGAGSTPIVVGDMVIATVGGRSGTGVVAVNARDGKTRWTAVDENAAYASPITIQIDKQSYVIAVLGLTTVMLEPATGNVIRKFDFGRRGPTVNAATPLAKGSRLFMTASYGIGCRMLDMATNPPADLWKENDVISSQYSTPVLVGDSLIAINGREDMGEASLLRADWNDGTVVWQKPSFGTAHLIAAGDRVLAQATDGRLELIDGKSDAFQALGTFSLPEGSYRSLPALAGGTLYCRRTMSSNAGEVLALDMIAK
jgi:outer membrane protein assembly factor BamB